MTKKQAAVFQEKDRVFAKVKGYPAWPARVEKANDAKGARYQVFFYGTYETATVKREEMWHYTPETLAKYGKNKKKGFAQGLFEIENHPDLVTQDQLPPLELEPKDTDTTLEESNLSIVEPPTPTATPKTAATPASAAAGSSKKAATKRKAETPTGHTPTAKQTKVATPATPAAAPSGEAPDTPNTDGKTSRSGRAIKPKKFADDKESTPLKPATDGEGKKKSEPRKMWVQVKATNDTIEINLDQDRPVAFESKKAELEWDRISAKNALKFKSLVESGQFIPEEILKKLEAKADRTPAENEILANERLTNDRREKVRWLKIEQRLMDLDVELKASMHYLEPNMERCIELLEELSSLSVTKLMLKKQPEIVLTIRKARKYVGPSDASNTDETLVNKIRLKSNAIYSSFQTKFAAPENENFGKFFKNKIAEFTNATKSMEKEAVMHMVEDPTETSTD